jgi:hypothetical protein
MFIRFFIGAKKLEESFVPLSEISKNHIRINDAAMITTNGGCFMLL